MHQRTAGHGHGSSGASARGTKRWRWAILGAVLVATSGPGLSPAGAQSDPEATPELAPRVIRSWGTAGSEPGQFTFPSDVAVAPDGTVYVLEIGDNSRVQAFTGTGEFLRQWGGPGEGPGQFTLPSAISVAPDGSVFVQEGRSDENPRVQHFTAEGTLLPPWNHPFPMAFSAGGNALVGVHPRKVRELDAGGNTVREIALPATTDGISGIDVDDAGSLYVASFRDFDSGPVSTIRVYRPDGTPVRNFKVLGGGVAVHPDGYVFTLSSSVYRYTDRGVLIDAWPRALPAGLDIDASGRVFVAELFGNRVTVANFLGPDRWVRRPDGRVLAGFNAMVGDNVYNTTGAGQTSIERTSYRATSFATINVQNGGNVADRFTIKAAAGTSQFTVRYRIGTGGPYITPQVVAGTYTTPVLLPGEFQAVTVEITPAAPAPRGATFTRLATARSVADPSKRDVVGFGRTLI